MSATASAAGRSAGLRDFLLIWFGQLVSGVGSRLTSFALGVWVYQTTGSTTRFALVFVAMAIPALVLSPFVLTPINWHGMDAGLRAEIGWYAWVLAGLVASLPGALFIGEVLAGKSTAEVEESFPEETL